MSDVVQGIGGAALIYYGGWWGFAVVAAYNLYQARRLANKRQSPTPDSSTPFINQASSDFPIPVVYGFRRIKDPTIVYRALDELPTNFQNVPIPSKFLILVAVLSEGPIEAVEGVWLDGKHWSESGLDWTWHPGEDNQTADATLLAITAGKFTANDIGAGIAYAVVKISVNSIAFPGREPKLWFDVRGKKVKDTRDGITRFSPNPALHTRDFAINTRYGRRADIARVPDSEISAAADYFEERIALQSLAKTFTVNPDTDVLAFTEEVPFAAGDGVRISSTGAVPGGLSAGVTYYWIRDAGTRISFFSRTVSNGKPERTGRLASTYANALAAIPIDITSQGSGTLTCTHFDQPRYHCSAILDPFANPLDNFDKLRSSCRSWFFESGGSFHLLPEKVTAPTFDLTVDNIVGRWSIDLGDPAAKYNRVDAHFVNEIIGYEDDVATSQAGDGSELAADGGRPNLGTPQLDCTTNPYMAERLALLARRGSRLGLRVECNVHVQGFKATVGDVVRLTHPTPGMVNKLFRLERFPIAQNDEYRVSLTEYADAAYTLDAQAAMVVPSRTNLPGLFNQLSGFPPPNVSGLEVFTP